MNDNAPPDLAALLAIYPLFQTLDDETLRTLVLQMEEVGLAEGQTLFRQGDAGDAMYVVVSGALGVQMQDEGGTTTLNRVGPGETVGEMALLTGQPRSATVHALSDSRLIRLSKPAFDGLIEQQPEIARRLAQNVLPLFHRTQLARILTRLLGRLDMAAIHDLEARFEWQSVASGDLLIRQGDPGDAMFIVVNGRLRVVRRDDLGSEQIVGEMGAGQIVGEFALLTDEPRSATVYAVRDTTVVRLSRDAFEQVMERYPRSLMGITRLVLKQRHRTAGTPTADAASTFALVPLHASARLRSFAGQLTEALSALGATLPLDAARMDERYGKTGVSGLPQDHPLNTPVVAWLDEQERQHRYVVYEAEAHWSPWTERSVRRADRILLVADARDENAYTEVERVLQACPVKARRELVLLHPANCERPSGTRAWLEHREVAAHHHVRLDRQADLERLARRLTGQAWGLVLGGGGARGYAHVGVYRALVDAGLPIDFVGGTSMGAVLGACVAMGLDYDAIRRLADRLSSPLKLLDPTLPLVAVFSSTKVTRTLMGVYEDTQIEDLWCPFFSVSSNLTRAVETVHRKGPLWQAVRASMAIPGIFSPILCHGELEVDGAVLNNLPIDVMREVNQGGPIVAVNVSPEVDLTTSYRFGPSISGSRALLSLLNPVDTLSVPLIFESLLRVIALNDVQRAKTKRHLASIYVCPPVDRFGLLEFGSWAQIIEAGYRAGVEAIEKSRGPSERTPASAVAAPPSGPVLDRLEAALDRLEGMLPAGVGS